MSYKSSPGFLGISTVDKVIDKIVFDQGTFYLSKFL